MKKLATFNALSEFNEAGAAAVCQRIAGGESLRVICSDSAMPSRSTIHRWLLDREDFRVAMAIARDMQADTLAEEILSIPETEPDPNKARLMVEVRRWYASKLRPKKYGDRVEHEVSSDIDIVVTIGGNPNDQKENARNR